MNNIPKEIQSLPKNAQTFYRAVFNKSKSRGNTESKSNKIAWTSVKSRLERKGNAWVARSGAFKETTYYTFAAKKSEEFVSRTEDGGVVHKYVLSDLWPDEVGTRPSPELLNAFAKQAVGMEIDTDHELWNHALKQIGMKTELMRKEESTEDFISEFMGQKKGIAKIIDAVVDAGKLIVSILFDKRYHNFIDLIKGLSIEAGVETNEETGEWEEGSLFGATFAVNTDPLNPRATRFMA